MQALRRALCRRHGAAQLDMRWWEGASGRGLARAARVSEPPEVLELDGEARGQGNVITADLRTSARLNPELAAVVLAQDKLQG